jgi:single-strand DNA-binding protein
MSISLNTVVLGGNLTKDPELRTIPSGKSVANMAIAVNEKYKASDGTWKETVVFVDCEVWNASADVAGKYLRKGSPVILEGKLKSDTWQTQAGEKRQKLILKVERLHLVGGRPDAAPAEPKPTKVAMPVAGADDEPPF